MDWLKAISVMELGMMTATRTGLAAGAAVGVAAGAQAATNSATAIKTAKTAWVKNPESQFDSLNFFWRIFLP
jgi:hypothetical protein